MSEFLLRYETFFRLGIFIGVFVLMALWEILAPKRTLQVSKPLRWVNNIGLVFLNTAILHLLLRLVFPAAAVGFAILVDSKGWGLLNLFALPEVLSIILAVILLDMAIYLQHVLVHAVPALWRLHRVHHADLDIDVTTGARFHPIEIILSMGIKFAVIMIIGAPAIAVLIFEVVLNAMSMFNHSNIALPKPLDHIIRYLFVTPDMHRVHHSIIDDETNSNFGFNLSFWDRLFGTYRDQPQAGHIKMTIGIRQFRDSRYQFLDRMLAIPFIGKVAGYTINRREWTDEQESEK